LCCLRFSQATVRIKISVVKIAIVGAGAVGLYYGAMLARQNPEVHFHVRSGYDAVRERGIEVLSPLGDFRLQPVHAHATVQSIGACDAVIIATKATANKVLLEWLPPLLQRNTMLVTLQNGLGNEEFLAQHFGEERVLGGKCFVCLNRIAPGVVRHIGHGVIQLGEWQRPAQERTHRLGEMFNAAGIKCEVRDDIKEVLWRKLTWNIPFNGLAIAAGGIDVGQILSDATLLALTRALMQETIAIARAEGVPIEESYIDFQINRTLPMGAYKPSSLLDYEAGREVEIEPIWGEPLRRARLRGIAASQLERLYEQLRERCGLAAEQK
jgi:2-dehydropantoate 2-reductase